MARLSALAKSIKHCRLGTGGVYSPLDTAADCEFDGTAAEVAIRFFEKMLRHVSGPKGGHPLELAAWQKNVIGTMFGWKRPDETRRYRQAYVEIPRKAGKSTLAAGIALFALFDEEEHGRQVFSCASDRDQAKIVFEIAKQNVQQHKWMRDRTKQYLSAIQCFDPSSGIVTGTYRAVSSDAGTKHGYSPSCTIFDELHAQKNRELWDVMITGVGARLHPLTVAITTAGWDRNSVCWEQHQYAEKIRDGILENPSFLPVIYAAPENSDWTSPETWKAAQPNLGISVPESFYRDECLRAIQNPSEENTFKRLYLNIWTEQAVRWISMEHWDACQKETQWTELHGAPCWAGLDLSSSVDISAFVMAFPVDSRIVLVPHFWICEEQAKRIERSDRVPYREWARLGLITITEGNVVDYDRIRRDIRELAEAYNIQEIAADRWNATQLITQLQQDGHNVIPFGQGYASMSGPSKEFEKLILGKQLQHDGNKILRWMASNVTTLPDAAGNIKPVKDKSTGRIDGIVAAIMAIGRATTSQQPYSYYETNGLEMA